MTTRRSGFVPSVNYFEIVGEVIEVLITDLAEREDQSREAVYAKVLDHLKANASEWRSGRQPNIQYDDPFCRIAYLYTIVPANAGLIQRILDHDHDLEEYIDGVVEARDRLRVCAFGGGPGTELLGLAKWIERQFYQRSIYLDFLLLDRVPEWGETWGDMKDRIHERADQVNGRDRSKWPLVIADSFQPIDITDTSHFANVGRLFKQDLYVLSWVVSEIYDHQADLRSFTATMAKHAPPGARFLFVDRCEQKWKEAIKELAQESGLILGTFHDTNSGLDFTERKEGLGRVFEDMREHRSPKIDWSAFWAVGVKDGEVAPPRTN